MTVSYTKQRIAHRAGEEENVISLNKATTPRHSAIASKSGSQYRMTNPLKIAVVNSRSVRNKTADIIEYIISTALDITLLTETWLTVSDAVIRAELKPPGYNFKVTPRSYRGGGVAILYKTGIKCKPLSLGAYSSFEYGHYELLYENIKMYTHVIYRPPYSEAHRITTATFFVEFQTYLSHAVQTCNALLIAGDFNIHMNVNGDVDKIRMCDLLNMYDLTQHVAVPTHISGHTLDLITTRCNHELVLRDPGADYMVSDHTFVCCQIKLPKPSLVTRTISYRKLKNIDKSAFSAELKAPTKTKTIVVRPCVPWFDDELKAFKSYRRYTEKLWRKNKNNTTLVAFHNARNAYVRSLNNKRT